MAHLDAEKVQESKVVHDGGEFGRPINDLAGYVNDHRGVAVHRDIRRCIAKQIGEWRL